MQCPEICRRGCSTDRETNVRTAAIDVRSYTVTLELDFSSCTHKYHHKYRVDTCPLQCRLTRFWTSPPPYLEAFFRLTRATVNERRRHARAVSCFRPSSKKTNIVFYAFNTLVNRAPACV